VPRRTLDDEDTFAYWVSLGDWRSFAKVAEHFGVARRAIQKCSLRNGWAKRLAAIQDASKKRADEMLVESIAEVRARHLRMLKVVATRGLQALQSKELETAHEGVKAVTEAIKLERVIHGETTANVAVSVQEVTRREMETYLRRDDEADLLDDGDAEEDPDDDLPDEDEA